MNKIISLLEHKQSKQFENVQLSASKVLDELHNRNIGKDLQKQYMKMLSKGEYKK